VGTSFACDAWGRMISKTRGNYSAGYAWGEGDKLTGVASSFPGEGSVTYAYGGDGKRRERNDGTLTKYRWDRGWNVLHEENGSGGLTLSLVPHRADIAGSSPATGTIRYTLTDHLGSLRALYAPDKTRLGRQEYTPYGSDYLQTGASATRAYTGHDRDAATGLYFAPYRHYSPDLARWLSRDPAGTIDGPNVYAFVLGDPVNLVDPSGLSCTKNERFLVTLACYIGGDEGIFGCPGARAFWTGETALIAMDLSTDKKLRKYVAKNLAKGVLKRLGQKALLNLIPGVGGVLAIAWEGAAVVRCAKRADEYCDGKGRMPGPPTFGRRSEI